MPLRNILLPVCCAVALCGAARADTFTGTDWRVCFNLPDQTTSPSSIGPDEFAIREAFLARIDALASNDWACLATYTWLGSSETVGAAGPILRAVSNALVRGARVGFVADKGVDIRSNYWPGVSLEKLAARSANPLQLSQAPTNSNIMHHKAGVFWYRAAGQAWVLSASWNFTGAASSQQWNILTEIQNNALGGAYSNEMRELLSGNFHSNTNKSHEHDGTRFRLAGTARDGWVRFAPYPSGSYGGSNALTDILAAIDDAQEEIFFGLNLLTRQGVVDALARACDRGVVVHGTIPISDRYLADSVFPELVNPKNFATRNRAVMFDACYDAARSRYDNGSFDLVHTKYMVIDPRGANPLVIHGSPNWTAGALVSTSSNDENVQFLPHREMALAFLAHFDRMTDGVKPWCAMGSAGAASPAWFDFWLPDAQPYELVSTTNLAAGLPTWTNRVQLLPVARGTNTLNLPRNDRSRFYRVRAVP